MPWSRGSTRHAPCRDRAEKPNAGRGHGASAEKARRQEDKFAAQTDPGTSVRHHQSSTWIPPVPAARARQGAWRVEPRDHGMEHQADVYPQLRLILPDAGPGCEKNGRRATWAVTTRSGRHQVPVAVLPTAKSLSAFSLKPQSDRLLGGLVSLQLLPGG